MDATNKKIQSYLDRVDKVAMAEVESLARQVLRRCSTLDEFVMGMGMAMFTVKNSGEILHTGEVKVAKKLNDFLNRWDPILKLTGTPIRFTAEGEACFDW